MHTHPNERARSFTYGHTNTQARSHAHRHTFSEVIIITWRMVRKCATFPFECLEWSTPACEYGPDRSRGCTLPGLGRRLKTHVRSVCYNMNLYTRHTSNIAGVLVFVRRVAEWVSGLK